MVCGRSMMEEKAIDKEVGKSCPTSGCPLCNPFSLAAFLVGFIVVFYTEWPYQLLGWLTVLLSCVFPLLLRR